MSNRPLQPGVSIVIPLYNAQAWIAETLESVLNQSYPRERLELIIVDDGSTDGSAEIAENALAGASLRHEIIQTDNGGPGRARNIGWRRAAGAWIQFLDADDVLHPEKIERQMAAAKAAPEDVAVVYSAWQRFGRVEQSWRPVGNVVAPQIENDPLADLLKAKNFIQLGAQLFRRTWLEAVSGFDERYWLIEDVHLLLRLAMAGAQFRRLDAGEPLCFYRQHDQDPLSRRNRQEFVEGCIRNAELVENHWRSKNALTPQRADILANVYFQGARHFAEADRRRFDALVDKIEALQPDFMPATPTHLRWLAKFVGYRKAERAAVWYRRLKACKSDRLSIAGVRTPHGRGSSLEESGS